MQIVPTIVVGYGMIFGDVAGRSGVCADDPDHLSLSLIALQGIIIDGGGGSRKGVLSQLSASPPLTLQLIELQRISAFVWFCLLRESQGVFHSKWHRLGTGMLTP